MAKQPRGYSAAAVSTSLTRYECPLPFHAVRARFLGSIAAPGLTTKPIDEVKAIWGGTLPTFDSLDDANRLLELLIMGLWNDLTRHQRRSEPFRLTRGAVEPTRDAVARLARMRVEELDGFAEGLFGGGDNLDVPDRASRALDTLAEMRSLFQAAADTLQDERIPGSPADVAATLNRLHDMTKLAEREMHEVVLACTRARRHDLAMAMVSRKTMH